MTRKPDDTFPKFKSGVTQGLTKGWKGLIWLLKIIIPISFMTNLLVYSGIIYKLDFLLAPVMTWLSLPPLAAVVLITGLFTGIYGAVAVMAVMPFCMEHMILMAVFILISHNLIQESMVQGKSGINPFFIGFFRLFFAFMFTLICAGIMGVTPETGSQVIVQAEFGEETVYFGVMLQEWGWKIFKLVIQIFCIIMPLMVALELARIFKVIDLLTKGTAPFLKILGLSPLTGVIWLTAGVFGLTYGAAVIVEETESKKFKQQDLNKLHFSIGINHAMIEDPALFLPFGISLFWLWIPRLAAAVTAVWLYILFLSARRFYVNRFVHKKLCNHR